VGRALPAGPYEAIIQVQADDDHHIVQYPVVFCVKTCPGGGHRVSATTDDGSAVTIDGLAPGRHTLTIATRARTGTVSFLPTQQPVPIAWTLHGNGRVATASIVLPYRSTWTVVFDLPHGQASSVTLGP
jgi:hypothetical protein